MPEALQAEVQVRLSRIEGQVKGLQRMVDDDRYCVEVFNQVDAVRAALRQVAKLILRNHLETCIARAALEGDTQVYDELMDVINRYNRE